MKKIILLSICFISFTHASQSVSDVRESQSCKRPWRASTIRCFSELGTAGAIGASLFHMITHTFSSARKQKNNFAPSMLGAVSKSIATTAAISPTFFVLLDDMYHSIKNNVKDTQRVVQEKQPETRIENLLRIARNPFTRIAFGATNLGAVGLYLYLNKAAKTMLKLHTETYTHECQSISFQMKGISRCQISALIYMTALVAQGLAFIIDGVVTLLPSKSNQQPN
jgi:hypothetical protein